MRSVIQNALGLLAAMAVAMVAMAPLASAQNYNDFSPNGFDASDPYICGVGFFGAINGGEPGYVLDYNLVSTGGGSDIALGTFPVAAAGDFTSPSGFIAPLAGVNDTFTANVLVTDSVGQTVNITFDFTADSPCTPPAGPNIGPNPSGDDLLLAIQGNNAANDAEQAAMQAAKAAANGDVAGAAVASAKATAAADKAAQALADAKKAGAPQYIIDQLKDASDRAAAAAKAAKASAAGASAPIAVAVPAPSLAFTGSSVNLPLAAGAVLVGSGGLVLLAARKREQRS